MAKSGLKESAWTIGIVTGGVIWSWLRLPVESKVVANTICCSLAVVVLPAFMYIANETYKLAGRGGLLAGLKQQVGDERDGGGNEGRDR